MAWNPGVWRLHCHKLHHIINAHADVPMGLMGHGGMFTLVDVIRYERGQDHLAAFLIPARGRIERVELGPAAPIATAIERWRSEIQRH